VSAPSSETAECQFAALAVTHDVWPAGNAVTIAVVRIGMREYIGRRDLLDQAEANHRRRHAR
jgi:hypothetical protein